jgi:hypothetical protein
MINFFALLLFVVSQICFKGLMDDGHHFSFIPELKKDSM